MGEKVPGYVRLVGESPTKCLTLFHCEVTLTLIIRVKRLFQKVSITSISSMDETAVMWGIT